MNLNQKVHIVNAGFIWNIFIYGVHMSNMKSYLSWFKNDWLVHFKHSLKPTTKKTDSTKPYASNLSTREHVYTLRISVFNVIFHMCASTTRKPKACRDLRAQNWCDWKTVIDAELPCLFMVDFNVLRIFMFLESYYIYKLKGVQKQECLPSGTHKCRKHFACKLSLWPSECNLIIIIK